MNAIRRIARRLRSMRGREIGWRVRTATRDLSDQFRVAVAGSRWRREALAHAIVLPSAEVRHALAAGRWMDAHRGLARHFAGRPPRVPFGPAARAAVREAIARWCPDAPRAARARADRMCEGRYDLLGFTNLDVAGRKAPRDASCAIPDWHADAVHHRRAPRQFWTRVPYLDPRFGDHKIIWELNRHQHWLLLGRAWWLTGERRYRDAVFAQLEDWLQENPPLCGINWASALELGFRSLSWIAALHLLLDGEGRLKPAPTSEDVGAGPREDVAAGTREDVGAGFSRPDHPFDFARPEGDDRPWLVDLLLGLDRQLRHVEHHLSQYFSPNTHLTGEALALYVAGRVLPELRASARWTATGRRVLLHEIDRQIGADGGHVERSMHYHRYTVDFYLLALAVARLTGDSAEGRFADAARRSARFLRAIADDGGRVPQIGDDDGGRLWPLSDRPAWDVRDTLAYAAWLLDEPDLRVDPSDVPEEAIWLSGGRIAPLEGGAALTPPPRSTALTATGYVVSRTGGGDLLVFDAGRHGYLNGGHAHADALAVTATLRGRPLLIDPGTSTYTMDPQVRDRMRSTALHNTLTIDGRSSSVPRGPFHWETAADAELLRALTPQAFDYAEAVHTGYAARLHRRLVYRVPTGGWALVDDIEGEGTAMLALHWHLAPEWTAERLNPHAIALGLPDGAAAWLLTTAACDEVLRGDRATGLGWHAPVYGPLRPTTTLRAVESSMLPRALLTVILPGDVHGDAASIQPLHLVAAPGRLYAYSGGVVRRSRTTDVFLAAVSEDREPRAAGINIDTDARFLHVQESLDGPAMRLSIVEGRHVQVRGAQSIRVDAESCMADLHLVIDGPALLLLSDGALPALEIELPPASGVDRVLVNGARVETVRAGSRIRIGGLAEGSIPALARLSAATAP